jgi:signal transduction histidine kinase
VIERVLINLVGNALKFSEEKTRVTVTVAAEPEAIRVTVEDAGPGIPEDQLGLIFEKFGRAKLQQPNRGTGLGLTFCRMAVEAHGGEIGVTSTLGKGTCFWFRLPSSIRRELISGVAP